MCSWCAMDPDVVFAVVVCTCTSCTCTVCIGVVCTSVEFAGVVWLLYAGAVCTCVVSVGVAIYQLVCVLCISVVCSCTFCGLCISCRCAVCVAWLCIMFMIMYVPSGHSKVASTLIFDFMQLCIMVDNDSWWDIALATWISSFWTDTFASHHKYE